MTTLLLASTQRTVGWVLASIVLVGMGIYLLFNFRIGKREVGSEIELAPNRISHADDDLLETRLLDRNLAWSLVTLTVVSLVLPLYWLMEPARQDNAAYGWVKRFEKRGLLYYRWCRWRFRSSGGLESAGTNHGAESLQRVGSGTHPQLRPARESYACVGPCWRRADDLPAGSPTNRLPALDPVVA